MRLPFLDVPIVLAPMGGAATVALVAAVCEAGGFGILACAYSTPEQIARDVAELRSLTKRPFGINLFVEAQPYERDDSRIATAHAALRRYRAELDIDHPAVPAAPPEHYARQLEATLLARPAAFSFTFGIPDAETIGRFRDAGIVTLGTATTVAEARALRDAGIDAIVAQGSEAGAHRGTFLAPVEDSLVGTLALVPQVIDATGLPVIAAGGIGDGRGVAAVLALGAQAAALGTAFLLADESGISAPYRSALASARAERTVLTRAFSGRTARGIPNRITAELHDPGDLAPYPFQNAMTRDIRNAAGARGNAEFLSLWAGQAAPLARTGVAAEIVAQVMREARIAAEAAARALQ